ncbi:unnamed protein product [Triticum turgidum subsp. durum]|uniref:Uncharacterized protein n=1 Tax=Triticum turgidum subsp. durum TaxID=4567 RepID=A0A9R0WEP9_TRITD|nr:unnamed protein product [Triticum turgidum subsp. durum]
MIVIVQFIAQPAYSRSSRPLIYKHQRVFSFTWIVLFTFHLSCSTFFKQFHRSLARTVKSLLKHSETSQAIFLSPKRGDSLNKFLDIIKEYDLCYELIENYDSTVWNLHKSYLAGDDTSWPNYNEEHCYPLLVRITFGHFV